MPVDDIEAGGDAQVAGSALGTEALEPANRQRSDIDGAQVESHYTAIRLAAGWSRDRAAAAANVSYPTCARFELVGPRAIRNVDKRQSLVLTYGLLERIAAARASEKSA